MLEEKLWGRLNRRREARWWNETVQQTIKEKKEAYKKLQKAVKRKTERHASN